MPNLHVDIVLITLNCSLEDLQIGEEVATCPSCSLLIRVIYDQDQFADYESDEEVTNLAQGPGRVFEIIFRLL